MYGFQKFNGYVYGLPKFVAETDHKPLISIIKKNLSEMSPRIQRLMMKLTSLSIVNLITKSLPVSDRKSKADCCRNTERYKLTESP